ncbi:MAG: sigma-70 family RNA polymerase sigma factor [Actinomycetes bacterium]
MTPFRIPTPVAERDLRSEDELVSAHLPLVGYLVSELIGRLPAHVSRDELRSAGLAALAQAARGFDSSRGVPFSRFAATRIRGALLDELRSHDWASRSVRATARRRDLAVEKLTGLLGRTPTKQELAAQMGVAVSRLDSVDDDVHRATILSLQGFSDTAVVEELVPDRAPGPEASLLARENEGYLRDAVSALPDRLRTVVVEYFLAERAMADIAADLGVSESRVSQMRAEALVLLKDGMNSQLDPDRLGTPTRPDGCVARRREAYYAAIAARSDLRTRLEVPEPSPPAPRSSEVASA